MENADDLGLLKRRLTELVGDAIILADQAKFDVFNALTLMDNPLFLKELKVSVPGTHEGCSFSSQLDPRSSDRAMDCSTSI